MRTLLVLVFLAAGCTAAQWQKAEDKAEGVKAGAETAAVVAGALPLPATIKAPAVGIAEGVAAIAAAVAAFCEWRRRAAQAKFDVVSAAGDNLGGDASAAFKESVVEAAGKLGVTLASLKTAHHESIIRRE
jgi:hypothetical protein